MKQPGINRNAAPVIAVGARNVGQAGSTGVSVYASILQRALEAEGLLALWAGGTDLTNRPHAFGSRVARFVKALPAHQRLEFSTRQQNWSNPDLFRKVQVHFSTFRRITKLCSSINPNVVHWAYPYPMCWENILNIYTVHDLIPLVRPDLTGINSVRMHDILQQCFHHATRIVTISEAVRQDIARFFPEHIDKVVNLSQAVSVVDEEDNQTNQPAQVDASVADGFLYFGTIEKRKNIGRLIHAHAQCRTRRPLVLIGNDGFQAEEEWAALASHPQPELVHRIHWCPRAQLLQAIRQARAVVFPSLAEGFGLPIVEAMALGTPVMTSLGHATEEVAGGAALLVNPMNVQEIAEALACLDHDDALCHLLAASGFERANDFSFGSYATRLGNFYRSMEGI